MKRFLMIAVALILCTFSAFTVGAQTVDIQIDSQSEVLGAEYYDYSIYGSVADNTADVHCIEFGPDSGLIPMPYAANAGRVTLSQDHVAAAEAEGYTVVGAINGSFFEMSTGNPCGTLISDGKLVFTHAALSGESIAVFGYDGSCQLVYSTLQFKMTLAGKNVPTGIGLVNKKYSACSLTSSDLTGRFHYYDIDAGDLSDESVAGYEIICEKLDGTDLAVGKTLSAKVLEIKSDSTFGATKITEENKFVLFLKNDSSKFLDRMETLAVGDAIAITPTESDVRYKDAMHNAFGAISSSYWLVKDGEDLTDKVATIVHSTSLARAWTAFGFKEDGSYVFWASEEVVDGEKAITLKDVADAMIEMGCTNVIRLDGGGSTSICVNGIGSPITTVRPVCDVLLIVEKDDIKSTPVANEPDVSVPETSEPEVSEPETSDVESEVSDESEVVSEPENESASSENGSESSTAEEENEGGSSNTGLIIGIVVAVAAVAVVIVIVISKKK